MFPCVTSPVPLFDIEVYEATGTVCADTGASQSVADGQKSTPLVQKATVPITVCGRTFQTDLIFLPHAKGNRRLLGVDFLKISGIVMNMRKNNCYFGDKPNCPNTFSKDIPLPTNDSPDELNNSYCPTSSISSDVPVQINPADETETSDLHLREEEGQDLDEETACELKTIVIDFPTRTASELRTEQLKDLGLNKIIDCLENPNKGVDFAN
ncbi:transposon Tf2-6 polyprotein [Nephila pilipes]|uniref:Transposon Tf2-6 polyprotein n=1 Tax=Nephila pilipes TaxID=299642 RepID=A0A8X6U9T8_NEPPI|nr:transposon Tf2-6 polyprotein [Nephila pilipes]